MLWIVTILIFLDYVGVAPSLEDDNFVHVCRGSVGSLCMLFVSIFMIYSISFLRWETENGRWRAPLVPLGGLCVVLLGAWPLGVCFGVSTKAPPSSGFVPIFMAVSCVWATGFVGLGVVALLIGCCIASLSASGSEAATRSSIDEDSDTDKPMVYQYQEPGPNNYNQEWLENNPSMELVNMDRN